MSMATDTPACETHTASTHDKHALIASIRCAMTPEARGQPGSCNVGVTHCMSMSLVAGHRYYADSPSLSSEVTSQAFAGQTLGPKRTLTSDHLTLTVAWWWCCKGRCMDASQMLRGTPPTASDSCCGWQEDFGGRHCVFIVPIQLVGGRALIIIETRNSLIQRLSVSDCQVTTSRSSTPPSELKRTCRLIVARSDNANFFFAIATIQQARSPCRARAGCAHTRRRPAHIRTIQN